MSARLFASRRLLPLFLVQFLGALNDNLYRNAIFVMIAFQLTAQVGDKGPLLLSLGAALFILPFFLFSATAGAVSDRYAKSWLVQRLKAIEVALVVLSAGALVWQNVTALLATLFLLGIQAAFFGPVKYSILPDLVAADELAVANGYVEGGTFIAILIGTIAGGIVGTWPHGPVLIAAAMGGLGLLGWAMAFAVPPTREGDATHPVRWRVLAGTMPLLRTAAQNKPVWRALLGISWFWFVGAIFLSVLPAFVKDSLNGEARLVTVLMTMFSVGIALGSVVCGQWQKRRGGIIPRRVGAIGLAVAIFTLWWCSTRWQIPLEPIGAVRFLHTPAGLGIALSLFALAFFGGLYTVPLYTTMQAQSDPAHRARIVAANNILNSFFMVVSSLYTMAMVQAHFTYSAIFLSLGIVAALIACLYAGIDARPAIKFLVRSLLRVLYAARLDGEGHLRGLTGRGAVIIVNHVSLLDGVLLAAFLPGYPIFAINTQIAGQWWARLPLLLVDHYLLDPTNPMALKTLAEAARRGRQIVIFPEGRITITGGLMKIYEGPGIVAASADVPLVPVRIDGAQFTPLSYLRGKVPQRWFPRITLTALPPVSAQVEAGLTGKVRRQAIADQLYDVMADMMFRTSDTGLTLFDALLAARARFGGATAIIEDIRRQPMDYDRLLLGASVLGRRLDRLSPGTAPVGVLLANSCALPSVLFGLWGWGRVPALLNFTAGVANLRSAIVTGAIGCVVTSRTFVEKAELGEVVAALEATTRFVYLEDVATAVTGVERLAGLLKRPFARQLYQSQRGSPDDTAVILFTSGSEGAPKGVALSHRNIVANLYQLAAKIDYIANDIVFSPLPAFHAFGLTAGLLLPILGGVRVFTYPSPLHYRTIAELIYDTNATILFGTDTFLAGYGRAADPFDFHHLRYVFAGAEKLTDETRRLWQDKFGLRILEGYGVTETAPALAFNTPMQNCAGSVGRLLPGIDYRLEPVEGIATGGRLMVRGPNVMRGYYQPDRPATLQPLEGGWYDTGDVVTLDARGFVTIVGRVKRFAKIGGEMISLAAVEACIQAMQPDAPVAVVSVPDPRRGEQIVLFTTFDVTRDAILQRAQALGLSEMTVPRRIVRVEELPKLGSGKTDYVTLNRQSADSATGEAG